MLRHSCCNLNSNINRKWTVKICKGLLLMVLLVTVVINVTFILENSRKLKFESESKDEPVFQTEKTANTGDHDTNVQEMSQKEVPPRTILLQVISSRSLVSLSVDDKIVINNEGFDVDRGIHVMVLNQATGSVMARRIFDTYQQQEDEAMVEFLKTISNGRILIFAIKDEGTFQLKEPSRLVLADLGSKAALALNWRDMWAFVTIKGGKKIAEWSNKSPDLGSWGDQVILTADVQLSMLKDSECPWAPTEANKRRRAFCTQLEGYGGVCDCQAPVPIDIPVKPLKNGQVLDIPVSVIASNRPHYLYRMLRTLLSTPGVPADKITVFIDGYFDEPLEVTKLLNVRGIQHSPLGVKNARISQHYKASLTATFSLFPEADYAILIEEDLDVSPDFFNYFYQTKPLLDDPTLYCISAWNDQGYEHSCKDPALLYRIETMPGLGWMLKKSLFQELEPQWPSHDKLWDWDMWMRHNMIRKDRECVIPDISRTYHFGAKGLNMNPYFQEKYFLKHSIMSLPNVKLKDIDKMKSEPYEDLVRKLIKSAKVLDHTKDPCSEGFIPSSNISQDNTFVLYIKMGTSTDFTTWKMLAKCYNLWDLDVRGFHKSMWRQFLHDKHILIVGVPASPYSDLKPDNVVPVYLEEKPDENAVKIRLEDNQANKDTEKHEGR